MMDNVITQVAALKTMTAAELKEQWKKLNESEPPPFNRGYLESRLAYRLQEIAYGGMKKDTVKRIEALRENIANNAPYKPGNKNRPPIGAILVREHRGIEHRVRVLKDGFDYNGKIYKSLTAVASNIAGVHWNGPMFFGLRRNR
ncbi:MAG: DUF2924 domain-containing protein [Pseudomonadota bacterium]|nr:DUF2924 domain-containing protein [Pseudomonadota bacterium]